MPKLVRVIVTKQIVQTMILCGPTDAAILQDAEDLTYIRNRAGLFNADLANTQPEIQVDILGDAELIRFESVPIGPYDWVRGRFFKAHGDA